LLYASSRYIRPEDGNFFEFFTEIQAELQVVLESIKKWEMN
jgi:hypothetical protein